MQIQYGDEYESQIHIHFAYTFTLIDIKAAGIESKQ